MRIVLIIPTYNEAENIETFIKKSLDVVRNKKDQYKLLVVDDNSPDGTAEIVKRMAAKRKEIILYTRRKKEGLGKAMIAGYKYALKNLKPDVVISTEADFAYEPKHVPYAVSKIKEGYDVVVASRHVGSGNTTGWTLNRKLNHWVANKFFANWIAGVSEVSDHNGAFRAIRVKGVLDRINLSKIAVTGFGFFNYFLYVLSKVTDNFYEFPVNYHFRKKGESKVSFNPKYFATYLHDIIEYIKLCLLIRFEKLGIVK